MFNVKALLNKIKAAKIERKRTKEEEIAAFEQRMARAARLKKLIETEEWKDFEYIINYTIENMMAHKLNTRLDTATQEGLKYLEYNDREMNTLQMVLLMPKSYISGVEKDKDKYK